MTAARLRQKSTNRRILSSRRLKKVAPKRRRERAANAHAAQAPSNRAADSRHPAVAQAATARTLPDSDNVERASAAAQIDQASTRTRRVSHWAAQPESALETRALRRGRCPIMSAADHSRDRSVLVVESILRSSQD